MTEFTKQEFSENIVKIPRKSGQVEKIHEYLYNWGIQHNIKTTKDKSGCIYYDVPATSGCEKYPSIIFQAHTDMVQTTQDPNYNMNNQPIDIVFDEETASYHSRDYKTNIGADDAEGIIAMMNLAINKNYKHGSLRLLFTYDEEVTMQGARELSLDVLNSDYLINIDAGPVGATCVSSAGILKTKLEHQYANTNQLLNTQLNIEISNFCGGHSGLDINKKLLSANVVMNELLKKLIDQDVNFQIESIEGGDKPNAIANISKASIFVDEKESNLVKDILTNEFDEQKKGFDKEKNAIIEISEKKTTATSALSVDDSKKLINMVSEIPHGCRESDNDVDKSPLVSSNFAMISLKNGMLDITIHSRSNINGKNDEVEAQLQQLAKEYGFTYTVENKYEGWEDSADNKLKALWEQSSLNACNIKNKEIKAHGGLEISRFLEKKPDLQMLAIGMDVAEEHMVTETLYTKSMPAFFAILLNFLENANQL